MTLRAKLAAAWSALRDLATHRPALAWGRVLTLGGIAFLALAMLSLYREARSALDWTATQAVPHVLKPIKAERDGRLALVAPPAGRPCVGELKPRDAKAAAEVAKLGVDFAKHSLLATGEIPKGAAPYGGSVVVVAPKAGGGQAEPIFTAANPLAALDNRWAFYGGPAYDSTLGPGARLGVEWDAFSVRLPARAGAFRLFARFALDGYLFNGRAEARGSALAVIRRP